jgi:CcmD family protein
LTTAEKYVTAAYLVVFAAVLVYVLIMATKLARLERDVEELTLLVRDRLAPGAADVEPEREEVRAG